MTQPVPPIKENADITFGTNIAMVIHKEYITEVAIKCSHSLVFLLIPINSIICYLQGAQITGIPITIKRSVPTLPISIK